MLERYSKKALLRRALRAERLAARLDKQLNPMRKQTISNLLAPKDAVWDFVEWVLESDIPHKGYVVHRARLLAHKINKRLQGKKPSEADFKEIAFLILTSKEWAI